MDNQAQQEPPQDPSGEKIDLSVQEPGSGQGGLGKVKALLAGKAKWVAVAIVAVIALIGAALMMSSNPAHPPAEPMAMTPVTPPVAPVVSHKPTPAPKVTAHKTSKKTTHTATKKSTKKKRTSR